MPRSTTTSRLQFRRAVDAVGNLPTGSAASTYTWAFSNVPTRGIVRRVNVLITDTAVTGGEGKSNTAAGDVTSIVSMFAWSMNHTDHLGGDQLFATSTYAIAFDVAPLQCSNTVDTGNVDGARDVTDIMYDVSGTTLGPAQGTGTLFFTISSPASGTAYSAFTGMTVTLDIEPLP